MRAAAQGPDHDLAAQPRLLCPVHLPHPTSTEERQNLVGAEACSGCERHRPSGAINRNPGNRAGAILVGVLALSGVSKTEFLAPSDVFNHVVGSR